MCLSAIAVSVSLQKECIIIPCNTGNHRLFVSCLDTDNGPSTVYREKCVELSHVFQTVLNFALLMVGVFWLRALI